MMNDNYNLTCPHCGAPALSRICAYCGSDTGLSHDEAVAQLEYPVLDYQDVTHDYTDAFVRFFVVLVFFLFGVFLASVNVFFAIIIGIPLAVYGIYHFYKGFIVGPAEDRAVRSRGKDYIALVFAYFDSDQAVTKEQKYAGKQTMALLIHTDEGNRFILCNTDKIYKRYHENASVNLKILGNKYIVYGEADEVVPI